MSRLTSGAVEGLPDVEARRGAAPVALALEFSGWQAAQIAVATVGGSVLGPVIPGLLGELSPEIPRLPSPATLSLSLASPGLAVRSFWFVPPAEVPRATIQPSHGNVRAAPQRPAPEAERAATAEGATDVGATPPQWSRIEPPRDIVKLEDRLRYVLQPPVETWLAGQELDLPWPPFPYQWQGIAFLYPRTAAVLADEMGLGKTMQAITTLRLLLHAREVQNVLLVCPKPLVSNWCRELAQWAPEIPTAVIEGDQTRRRWLWLEADAPLKIANYEILNRDRDVLSEPAARFSLVLLDESQRIKNRESSTSQVVRSIRRERSWALTGTPVENSQEDLVGIFEFLAPGYLAGETRLRRLGRKASSYVLRRTKDQVLTDLPPKLFRDAELELSAEQRASYRLAEEEGVLRLTDMGEAVTIQHVFELVLRLKQICNFDPATGESSKLERLAADLEEVAASGRKAIIFSQWVGTLRTLAEKLQAYHPLEYHGQVPSRERGRVLEAFEHERHRHVLLMSYGTGGVGLNLQFAGYVFLFDRWWNPAVEDQAINRAHRIGAAGPVTVSRFLTLETIEQRIDQVLRDKRAIFDAIFSESAPEQSCGLNREEIFGLFRLRCPQGKLEAA